MDKSGSDNEEVLGLQATNLTQSELEAIANLPQPPFPFLVIKPTADGE